MTNNVLLDVKKLKTHLFTDDGIVKAVDGVDIQLKRGESLGIVGESGSGKSMVSLSIMGLVPNPPGKIVDGEINFNGKNLLELPESEYRKMRGNNISMVFQEPMTSLNPVFTIGKQIMEVFIYHQNLSKNEAREKAIEMLKLVGIPMPEERLNSYPHQLSGGMRQRVMIAISLACQPELLIADEPTTALDVTIQAQILKLMKDLQTKLDTSIILITHDFGIVSEIADKIVVMYAGKIVEYSDIETIFSSPKHPYTKGLLSSIPDIDNPTDHLYAIPGTVPSPFEETVGCSFYPRCKNAMPTCKLKEPPLVKLSEENSVRCWLYERDVEDEE